MSNSGHLVLALPATASGLSAVRTAVGRWLSETGVAEPEASDVVLAVWEACANAIEHPVKPRSAEIVVEGDAGTDCISVSVRDTGHWQPPRASDLRGFGLAMVAGLMDEVFIDRRPDGTEVRMVRAVGPPRPLGLAELR